MTTTLEDRQGWRKSTYSGGGNTDCVEISWRKSSYSGSGNNDCVEVAIRAQAVGVRDSKNTAGPRLAFPAGAWRKFVGRIG